MRIQSHSRNNIAFKGALNNKLLLNSLEKISEHAMSFTAGVSLVAPLTIRPIAILSTPDTEKENKHYACANSICSGIIKFALLETVALPIETAVKKINENPDKFLNPQTIKNFTEDGTNLLKAKSYKVATQIIKMSTGFVTAIPKSMLTIAMIPFVMDKLFGTKPVKNEQKQEPIATKNIAFKGGFIDKVSTGIGKILDSIHFQNFAKKHQNQEKDIAKHMSAGTDLLLTSSFAYQTAKSKDIKENRKKALIYNNLISTGVTILGGYGLDKLIKEKSSTFVEKFKQANINDPKLHKYLEGINIARPALIFATIYYGLLPIFSTYFAEKIDKFIEGKNKIN